jgi:hypothetical protein
LCFLVVAGTTCLEEGTLFCFLVAPVTPGGEDVTLLRFLGVAGTACLEEVTLLRFLGVAGTACLEDVTLLRFLGVAGTTCLEEVTLLRFLGVAGTTCLEEVTLLRILVVAGMPGGEDVTAAVTLSRFLVLVPVLTAPATLTCGSLAILIFVASLLRILSLLRGAMAGAALAGLGVTSSASLSTVRSISSGASRSMISLAMFHVRSWARH